MQLTMSVQIYVESLQSRTSVLERQNTITLEFYLVG